jgi:hypothetical protein
MAQSGDATRFLGDQTRGVLLHARSLEDFLF